MDPMKLTVRGTEEVVAYACSKCRVVAKTQDAATACCVPPKCKGCGGPTERSWLTCSSCRDKESARHDKEVFDAATKVPLSEYDGTYVSRTRWGDDSDYISIDEIEEYAEEDEQDWYWACRPLTWPPLSARDIIENMVEDEFPEGAADWLDEDALQAALDTWLQAQPAVDFFITDESRVVIVRETAAEKGPEEIPE